MNPGEPTSLPSRACAVCGAADWLRLPDPGPRSMASDLRVLDAPLGTAACRRCGLLVRVAPPPPSIFERGYALYAHAPDDPRERARQSAYAGWIASRLPAHPRSIADVGCGNGSLLLAFRDLWPAATLTGCDPSEDAVACARAAGLDVWRGTIADRPDVRADLVSSVNVLEHADDPVAFLSALRAAVAPGGRAVVVCPDGSRPGVELLIADHRASFAPSHLRALLARAELETMDAAAAPPEIGDFQLAVAVPGAGSAPITRERNVDAARHYLEDWAALDARLLERVDDRDVVCFGAGEAAGLLRAYAPRTWSRVRACTMDSVAPGAMFGELPVVRIAAVDTAEALLLGVRPQDQPALAARLQAAHPHVVTWYDLVRVHG